MTTPGFEPPGLCLHNNHIFLINGPCCPYVNIIFFNTPPDYWFNNSVYLGPGSGFVNVIASINFVSTYFTSTIFHFILSRIKWYLYQCFLIDHNKLDFCTFEYMIGYLQIQFTCWCLYQYLIKPSWIHNANAIYSALQVDKATHDWPFDVKNI